MFVSKSNHESRNLRLTEKSLFRNEALPVNRQKSEEHRYRRHQREKNNAEGPPALKRGESTEEKYDDSFAVAAGIISEVAGASQNSASESEGEYGLCHKEGC